MTRKKITFGEMREMGVRGLLVYCSNYHCSQWVAISGDECQTSSSALQCEAFGTQGAELRVKVCAKEAARVVTEFAGLGRMFANSNRTLKAPSLSSMRLQAIAGLCIGSVDRPLTVNRQPAGGASNCDLRSHLDHPAGRNLEVIRGIVGGTAEAMNR